MPRTIAKVEVAGKTIYFFGLSETYALAEGQRRDALIGDDAYDARYYGNDEKATSSSIKGARKATAKAYIGALAEEMEGKTSAYCEKGRERSAIAVFACLYVEHKLSKEAAWQKVLTAVEESVKTLEEKEKADIIGQATGAIPWSEGYKALPTLYAET